MQRVFIDLADPDYEYVRKRVGDLAERSGVPVSTVALDDYFRGLIRDDRDRDRESDKVPVVVELDYGMADLLARMSERDDETVPDLVVALMVRGILSEIQR